MNDFELEKQLRHSADFIQERYNELLKAPERLDFVCEHVFHEKPLNSLDDFIERQLTANKPNVVLGNASVATDYAERQAEQISEDEESARRLVDSAYNEINSQQPTVQASTDKSPSAASIMSADEIDKKFEEMATYNSDIWQDAFDFQEPAA